MDKIILILSLFLFLILPVFADDDCYCDYSNWGITPSLQGQESSQEPSEQTWENMRNETIDENYGSEYSPSFLNRENIDLSDPYSIK
ncbi:MAG: hypothetical protein PHC64_03350 [Candidatus Gastranaerophilales bacterium]|nr:hypothetical protein [Candidatus Gastranaerophilales bacterium]